MENWGICLYADKNKPCLRAESFRAMKNEELTDSEFQIDEQKPMTPMFSSTPEIHGKHGSRI